MLLLLMLPLMAGRAYAYDFSAVCSTGQTLYYQIIDNQSRHVSLVRPETQLVNWDGWTNHEKPIGDIVLPSHVVYNGNTYVVTKIGDHCFASCHGMTGELVIPNTVTTIESNAFEYCTGFTGSIIIPNSVVTMKGGIFNGCTGFDDSIIIGDSVTAITSDVFRNCSAKLLVIGKSIESIGYCAFSSCRYINRIVVRTMTPPTIFDSYTFFGIDKAIPVFVPCGKTLSYQDADVWNSFGNYQEYSVEYELNVSSSDENKGLTSIVEYPSCSTGFAKVQAIPKNGYEFESWTENNQVVSTASIYSFIVNSDRNLVAKFRVSGSSIPEGAICGQFSVDTTRKVCFSKGNLQYQASTNTWRFGVNQYDIVGNESVGNVYENGIKCSNTRISSTYNGWIDLFGWGTSGNNHGAIAYQPWSTSSNDSDYFAYGSSANNLYDQSGTADWGYNAISNGGNQANLWRSLTQEEWKYIFNSRSTPSGIRYAKARVHGVNGIILVPDNWNTSVYSFMNYNQGGASYSTNKPSDAEWQACEIAGCVFIPAGGVRLGTWVGSPGSDGHYWTASCFSADYPYSLLFYDNSVSPVNNSDYRHYGYLVRLACDTPSVISYAIIASANPAVGGTVTGAGSYSHGANVTLAATANEGYTFINWTENDVEVSTDAEYSFTVEANRNLVANFAAASTGNHWNPDISLYSDNMSVVAEIHIDGDVQTSADIEIGAFCGEEVRGSRRVEYKGVPFDKYVAFLTVYGESNDNITFKVYDHQNNEELNCRVAQLLTFTPNGTVGDLIKPYVIEFFTTANITATANPAAGGTVSGDGVYSVGEIVTLTAIADEYYRFVNWTEDDVEVSTSETYSFTAFDDRNLVANFEIKNHWVPDESLYADNMSVVGEIRIDGMTQTSGDIEIGAFCGEEVRGSQRISYTPAPVDKYLVFLTVYGEPNDNIAFKLYNHQTGSEYDLTAPEPITFAPNATVGGLNTPHIFNFCHTQSRELTAGWNWYSTYIDIEGEDGFNMLTAGLGEDGLQVKSQSQFALYYPEYDIWTGSLNEADNHKLYMIQMSSPHTLVMTGAFTDVESTPITINKGWTWIGYPVTQNMSLDEATSNINPSNGDYFKSQSGFSIYYEGYGWAGSLNTLEPGHGYMYQNNGESPMTLAYPTPGARGTLEENVTADGNHWIPNAYQFADNMSVVAVINIDGVEQLSENLEVGAFSDGECRGSARPIYVEAVGRYMLFMTVYGEDGENLDFRLFDADDNEEYQLQTSMVFEPNGTVGNLVNPYVFDLSVMGIGEEQTFAFSFCPNPISSGRQLAIEGEYDKIEIINSTGVVIGEYTNTNEIEITMIPGVYYIRAINDKLIIINKLVVKQ